MTDINTELARIQQELKAGKDQSNDFGKYSYRSAEQILGALKPILGDCAITLSDSMEEVGGRVYVKSTAILRACDGNLLSATAFAREAESRKGMDDSQLTGSTSSYARKYALCGLFGIDDNKDADTNEFADAAKFDETIKDMNKGFTAHMQETLENYNSISAIKQGIIDGDLSLAREAWAELSEEVQTVLWRATSVGGCLTTKERKVMKSTEWKEA